VEFGVATRSLPEAAGRRGRLQERAASLAQSNDVGVDRGLGHRRCLRTPTSRHTIVLTSNTYGHVLEQRQRQVARAMDAVPGSVS